MIPFSAVRAGQQMAEALMTSTGRFTRNDPDAGPDWNEETGKYVDPTLTIYEGPCKVQTYEAFESEPDAGGAQRVIQRYYLHVPVSAGPFLPGDRAEIIASPNHLLVGNVYTVAGPHEKDWQTAQRLLADLDAGRS
jgi:hypothetical protein